MSITFKVQKNDEEWKKLQTRLRPLVKQPRAEVGVVGPQASEKHGDITLAELAAVHEYGSPKRGIPERSFIRSTIDANESSYENFLRPLLAQFLEGKLSAKKVLEKWGAKVAGDIRDRILKGTPLTPALSRKTIAARTKAAQQRQQQGGDQKLRDSGGRFLSLKNVGNRPLVNTGKLVSAITWQVVMSATKGESS